MKFTALSISSLIGIAIFTAAPQAFAEVHVSVSGNNSESNVSVHQEGTSQSTTCVNGKCTTTGGGGKATVCINGDCKTSEDGNIDIESDNGNTKVNIHNDTSASVGEMSPAPTHTEPTITVDPTIEQKMEDVKDEVDKTTDRIKERVKSEDSMLMQFVKEEVESLQRFIDNIFS